MDLDGTLIAVDSLKHSLRRLAVTRPWLLASVALALPRGRSWFKKRVADHVLPDAARLPYRPDVVSFLSDQRAKGRAIFLVTAADERIGERVAEHLGLFDRVIGSDGRSNVKAAAKVDAIRRVLETDVFDYMGDSMADLAVFRCARRSYLVHPAPRVERAARRTCRIERVFR